MRRKEDARVIKTKEKLFYAFKELLAEKPFEEITVNEVCIKAEVRRATFYKHFADKYHFLAVMTSSLITQFDVGMRRSRLKNFPVEYHIEYERKLVKFLVENEEIVYFIFKSHMLPNLIDIIVKEHYKILKERLAHSVENGEVLVASVDTVAMMLAGGIGNVLIKWFEDDKPCSQEELTQELESIVRAMFK